jgi:hydrogenase maturation protein HypF
LYNQLQQNFNCQETSSTGRVLDAVSVLLGFCKNKREYKHEPIDLLEKNSTEPYADIKPKIKKLTTGYCLLTVPLFEYLIKNLHQDKKRLAATAQLYIAKGLHEIVKKSQNVYFAGGMANNKIISSYLKSRGVITNKKIPCGDAGISFGQIWHCLLADAGD